MDWQITPIVVIYLLSAGLTAFVGLFVWSRRSVPGASAFAFLLWSLTAWTFFEALEYAVVGIESKILFAKLEYVGVASAPTLFLIFALRFSRRELWLTKRVYIVLVGFSIITFLMALTNDYHHLLWTQITPSSSNPAAYLIYQHGLWFWLNFVFTYILMMISTMVIINTAVKSHHIYRRQSWMLVFGVFLPWLGNFIYVFNLNPIPGLDWTPLGFLFSCIVISWAIFAFELFTIVPVAREAVFESIMDGVIVLDEMDRIADVNRAAQAMLGIDRRSLIGLPVTEAVSNWKNLIDLLPGLGTSKQELQPDPKRSWYIEMTVSDVRDRRGNKVGRAIVMRDITRRKDAERSRDNLVHTMVHDLRNPLSSIVFSLDMIRQRGDLSVDASNTLDIAQTSTERMLMLVNSILEIYRLENGELPLRREWSSLHSIVENRIRTQAPLIREKKILLVNHVPADLPRMLIDPTLIGRVIQNLIDNAIKFTPEGGMIEIVSEEDVSQNLVRISVIDSGIGISESVRGRLFEKFATSGIQRGSGLGLAFCKQVVEAHGGTIGADARAVGGTKFTFTLPLKN